jgi:putative transposase
MKLNDFGIIAHNEWKATATMRSDIELDEFVVMPNHIHGILIINRRGTMHRAPTSEQFGLPTSDSIPSIIRGYKAAVTVRINRMRQTYRAKIWQRNYYEHVIRSEPELNSIREYIQYNAAGWAEDENNPANRKPTPQM